MSFGLVESDVEEEALNIFRDLGYEVLYGSEVAPGERNAERSSYQEYILSGRLEQAIHRLNPKIPRDAQEAAIRNIKNPSALTLIQNNQSIHEMFTDGITVEYRRPYGSIAGDKVRLFDTKTPRTTNFS